MSRPAWLTGRMIALLAGGAVVTLLVAAQLIAPAGSDAPVELLGRGTAGGSRWAAVAQRADGAGCVEVRVDGALRKLMCGADWASPKRSSRIWYGPPPRDAHGTWEPVPVLRIRLAGEVLVASVVPAAVARIRLAGVGGQPDSELTARVLLPGKLAYVLDVVPAGRDGDVLAEAADGRRITYVSSVP